MIYNHEAVGRMREQLIGLLPEDLLREVHGLLGEFQGVIKRNYPPSNRPSSQYDEDYYIRELLPEKNGTYVDVGAGEPRECSNTNALYKDGWHGALIEPLPIFWAGILRQRPRDRLIPVAASDKQGFAKMLIQGTVSSLRPDWAPETQTELWVETDTITNLLTPEEMNCSLLSIDIEGHEAQALRGIDWKRMHPKVICVEYSTYVGELDLTSEWEPLLLQQGYVLKEKTRLNKIYALA